MKRSRSDDGILVQRSGPARRGEDGYVVLSTETPCESDGLVLTASGWDLSRIKDGVRLKAFYGHDTWAFPIGAWDDVHVRGKELVGKIDFADEEDPQRAGIARKLWDADFLQDVSVSFYVDWRAITGQLDAEDGKKYQISGRHVLREASIVGIGADQNAGKGRGEFDAAIARGIVTGDELDYFARGVSRRATVSPEGNAGSVGPGSARLDTSEPPAGTPAARDIKELVAEAINTPEVQAAIKAERSSRFARLVTAAVQRRINHHLGRLPD